MIASISRADFIAKLEIALKETNETSKLYFSYYFSKLLNCIAECVIINAVKN